MKYLSNCPAPGREVTGYIFIEDRLLQQVSVLQGKAKNHRSLAFTDRLKNCGSDTRIATLHIGKTTWRQQREKASQRRSVQGRL